MVSLCLLLCKIGRIMDKNLEFDELFVIFAALINPHQTHEMTFFHPIPSAARLQSFIRKPFRTTS